MPRASFGGRHILLVPAGVCYPAMDIRNLSELDLSALARRLQAEYPRESFTIDNVWAKIGDDAGAQPSRTWLAFRDGRLTAGLIGSLQGTTAYLKVMTCGPDTAAADAVLAAFEAQVAAEGAEKLNVSGSAPSYFLPGIDPTDTATLRFYLDRGFRKEREAFNMVADLTRLDFDLSADEAALAADGIRLARLGGEDIDALAAFMREHFSEGWLTETLAALRHDPVTCHVAWHDGRIIAFAATEVTNPGWFGPMGTDPAWRRHGLGRLTLLRCLADARAMGYRQVEIGWVGPLAFYARHCGAVVDRTFWMLTRPVPQG